MQHPLLTALQKAITEKDDALAEETALRVGTELGNDALPTLRDWQNSPERDRRWWAVRTLAAIGTPEAVGGLIAALEDPDPDVRACAVVGLAFLRAAEAVDPLVARLSDPSAYVARLAADALARIGAPAVPALIAALQEGDTVTRIGAARALSVIGPEEAVPALCAALDDPSALVTYYAEEALDKLGVGMLLFEP
ncbi:MAG: HEAT repeat domain-containing protein [Anaerolineae bacterium]|nr:HEAT repeat domain-containing protein [Anaerolineae bacterium]MDW7992382.1 HEAT repeat domain-containing protein [Anaerolineae bacterium]